VKVLQTLGRHGGAQEGVFQYKRSSNGVVIDNSIGAAAVEPPQATLTSQEWSAILMAIENASQATFRLTGQPPFNEPPNQSLYSIISSAVPNPAGGWSWHDSRKAAICAILEHEGSVDLYHGVLGASHAANITIARDIP